MRLKPIDLRRCQLNRGSGGYHEHPDISVRKQYLAKINGKFFAGRFSRQWYGWNFLGWHGTGLQLDMPGTNASSWQKLWEIQER